MTRSFVNEDDGFEKYPIWGPVTDDDRCSAVILLKTLPADRFDHSACDPQKFETCPDWGAKFQNPDGIRTRSLQGQRPLVTAEESPRSDSSIRLRPKRPIPSREPQ
jgi:hypothetical protein